jgi:triacylglycerol lipase
MNRGPAGTGRSLLRGVAAVVGATVGRSRRHRDVASVRRSSHEPVVLVHGYADTGATPWWDTLAAHLVDDGYAREAIHVLSLGDRPGTTVDSPERYAAVLGRHLRAVSEAHGSAVDVVAHSMGGLAARWCIEQRGGAQHVDSLVTLGTPHRGTYAAALGLATAGGQDMLPGSTFLDALDDGTLDPGVEYTAVWSRCDPLIVPTEHAKLPRRAIASNPTVRNVDAGRRGHLQLVADRAVFDRYRARLG